MQRAEKESALSDYEGRNLPQLLDLMHDVVTPEPISWLPQTTGWWIVTSWLIALLLLGALHGYLKWRRNRYRRDALVELRTIEQQGSLDGVAAHSIAALLKRTALAAYPRDQVASLYGAEWAGFLRESTGNDKIVAAGADQLAAMAYRPDGDVAALIRSARRWIEVHRA